MNLKARAQQGFTLIELMIVVAIIGILAAVAIPQYKNYTIKAKIGNALSAADSVKTAVALCIQENGAATGCSSGALGVPADVTGGVTKEVNAINTSGGVIKVTLASGIGTGVDGSKICWTPDTTTSANTVVWNASTNMPNTVDASITSAITKNNNATTAPACT